MAVERDVLDLVGRLGQRMPPALPRDRGLGVSIQPELVPASRPRDPRCPMGCSPISAAATAGSTSVGRVPPTRAVEPSGRAADALQRATGALSTAAMARMEPDMPWFRELSAEDRSWVGLIVQAGIRGFVDWYRSEAGRPDDGGSAVAASVFGAAPRALAGVINLQQTVDLVRALDRGGRGATSTSSSTPPTPPRCATRCSATPARSPSPPPRSTPGPPRCAAPGTPASRRWSSTPCCAPRPTRPLLSRASALGWAGPRRRRRRARRGARRQRTETDALRRGTPQRPGRAGMDALCAVQGDRLVVVLGGVDGPRAGGRSRWRTCSATGPVVVGPGRRRPRPGARLRPRGARRARGLPPAAGPRRRGRCAADDLLPERALAGDGHARRHLVDEVYLPLVAAPAAP